MKLFSKDHDPKKTRVVVAMSGGVDSSVTAALVAAAGYDVVGITLQLYDHGVALQKKGACCAGQDIYDAKRVAEQIGFPHYVLDYEQNFRQEVMEDFVESYLHGETPIPCVRCNQKVKFRDLLSMARELEAEALITGHYVRRIGTDEQSALHRATDHTRDQSYFMFTTTSEQLNFLRFPLGDMPKSKVRDFARQFNLEIAEKPDSQDICFVPNGKYAQVIEKLRPGALEAGEIVDVSGQVVGQHEGIIHYTIGQRRGLGVGGGDPLYVIALDPTHHRVIVGPREFLACATVQLKDMNWLVAPEAIANKSIDVKCRSSQEPVKAQVTLTKEGEASVTFIEPEYGVSPGQACVFYQEDQVLGGGWIARAPLQFQLENVRN